MGAFTATLTPSGLTNVTFIVGLAAEYSAKVRAHQTKYVDICRGKANSSYNIGGVAQPRPVVKAPSFEVRACGLDDR
jgi:hypothetical protein